MTRLAELRDADRETGQLLGALDVALPMKSPDSVMREAGNRKREAGSGARGRGVRRAAAVVAFLVMAAAVAAAIPSSPLHRLFVSMVGSSSEAAAKRTAARTPQAREAASPAVSFVAMPEASLEVSFSGTGVGGSVDVRLVDGDQVSLSSPTPAATYRISTNRIAVDQSIPAQFELDIPRSLSRLSVRVEGTTVYDRAGNALPDTFTINLSRPNAARH